MTDTLNQYGYQFQVKVLSAMLTDRNFTTQIYDIIDPEYFDAESVKFLIKNTKVYFKEYRTLPTIEVYKVQMESVTIPTLKTEIQKALVDTWKSLQSDDLNFVKQTVLNFCRNQELKKAILESVELLNQGKYDEIKVVVDNAIKAGMQDNTGLDYSEDVDYRYTDDEQSPRVPTGWAVLDELLGGGMPRGKLGVISMPSGFGKSYFLCSLAAAALKVGFNVFYYTLELDDKYVARRIDAALTGIDLRHLPTNIEVIKKRIERLTGKLIIKQYPTKRASLTTVNGHIDKMELLGVKPDLVIIDDPELLKFLEGKNRRPDEQIQELYEEIRGLSTEKNFCAWVPSQSNRSALESKGPADHESISSSYGKVFTADVVIYGDRRGKHKLKNTAEFRLAKNRFGPDGRILQAKFNTSTCQIEIYSEYSGDGEQKDYEEADKNQFLKDKYKAMVNAKKQEPISEF